MNTSYCSRAHLGMCSGINNPIALMTSKSHIVHEHISGCARAFITHCMLILHFNMVCGLIGRFTLTFILFDSSLGCRYWSYRYCIVSTSWDVLVYILHVSCFTLLWVQVHVVSYCLRVVRLVRNAPKQFSYVCCNVFAAGFVVRSESSFQIHRRSNHRICSGCPNPVVFLVQ